VKRILFLLLFCNSLFSFEQKTDISLKYINYTNYKNEILSDAKSVLKFENRYFDTHLNIECLYSSQFRTKRYLLLNELYIDKEFDEFEFSIGKSIKYQGELEGFNVTDFYNQKNYIFDPFDKSAKYGSIGAQLT